jgi:hypothetical protein
MPFAKIDTSSAGENQIVAAIAGKSIRVLAYKIFAAATVTVQWMDGTTEMEGPCTLTTGNNMTFTPNAGVGGLRLAYHETSPGNALQLNLGGAVQVSGYVEYQYVTH